MDKTPRVTIITAWYNGEKFVDSYMNAILAQTYNKEKIELFIINDGSTDNSDMLLKSYTDKLKHSGISYKYIHKENGGPSSALNKALLMFSGEYYSWIDMDDIIHNDYIEKKVNYMLSHKEVDYLISRGAVRELENNEKILGYTWNDIPTSREDLLRRIISGEKYNYEPQNFFVSKKIFLEAIPKRQIYDACGKMSGPNIQMMLPIIYHGKFGFLNEVLFDYYLHSNNMHNNYKMDDENKLEHFQNVELVKAKKKNRVMYEVFYNTINMLQIEEKEKNVLLDLVKLRVDRDALKKSFDYKDKQWYKETYRKFEKHTLKERIKYIIISWDLLFEIYNHIKNIRGKKHGKI